MALPQRNGYIPRIINRIRNIGIDYSMVVSQNSMTADEDESFYSVYAALSDKNTLEDEQPYSAPSYVEKRKYFRKFAQYPEIEYLLDCVCDDSIIADKWNVYCELIIKPECFTNEQTEALREYFKKIYTMLSFNVDNTAWNRFRQWLIDGCIAYEIVYDYVPVDVLQDRLIHLETRLSEIAEEEQEYGRIDEALNQERQQINESLSDVQSKLLKQITIYNNEEKDLINIAPDKIIGFIDLDPNQLTWVENVYNGETRQLWEYKDAKGQKRLLDKNQIIYIDYYSGDFSGNLSYVERLVRDFNLKRKVEDATVGWFIMNCQHRLKMVIPVGNKTTDKALQALRAVVSHYKEDLLIDFNTGEVTVNGKAAITYSRNIVVPSRSGSQSSVDVLQHQGPDLTNMKIVNYFDRQLKDVSRLPSRRFDRDNNQGGGKVIFYSDDNLTYEDLSYYNFINRMMQRFNQVLLQPLELSILLEFPELKVDPTLPTNFYVKHNSNFLIEDAKENISKKKKLDVIKSYENLKGDDGSPLFSAYWLYVEKFGIMTPEEFKRNKELIQKAKEEKDGKLH